MSTNESLLIANDLPLYQTDQIGSGLRSADSAPWYENSKFRK